MGTPQLNKLKTDLIIVGSEGAGCMAAIEAEKNKISTIMITKGQWGRSGATVTGAADFAVDSKSLNDEFGFKDADNQDSKDLFIEDTIKGGKYLNNQKLVRILVEEAPNRLRFLQDLGVDFGGSLIAASGHSSPRGVFLPGPNFIQALKKRTRSVANLAIMENTVVLDIVVDKRTVRGVIALNMENGEFLFVESKAVVLASGGAMGVYRYSTAPVELTGDGFAMAAKIGIPLVDMEFPMFFPGMFAYPSALKKVEVPYHLSSAGLIYGHMYNSHGERFMKNWDPVHLEHATRDIVSVAIYNEILKGRVSKHGGIYVSLKHLPDDLIDDIIDWDPVGSFKKYGFGKAHFDIQHYLPDLKRYSLEALPACHFSNGGVVIDENCICPGISGLFAAGEITGGIHGGNRLSGTAFADFLVFGKIAGENAANFTQQSDAEGEVPQSTIDNLCEPYFKILERKKGLNAFQTKKRLQELAWEKIGIIRTLNGIGEGLENIKNFKEEIKSNLFVSSQDLIMNREFLTSIECLNLSENIEMIALTASNRLESRGAHYLSDNPMTNYSEWTKNTEIKLVNGKYELNTRPIVTDGFQPPKGEVPYGQMEGE